MIPILINIIVQFNDRNILDKLVITERYRDIVEELVAIHNKEVQLRQKGKRMGIKMG